MTETIENGTREEINGIINIYYDGYWIKHYQPPVDNLSAKKSLIQSLTRRLFNHMEHGINIPGRLLDEVRASYDVELDPKKKRVKAGMLAGALFNRAADIFTHLVELEASGVEILPENDLMHTCGSCLREALLLGKLVKHRNGDEGIDELWGEPFKAFIMSVSSFYESRYVKIAMTMRNIDQVASYMINFIKDDPRFIGLEPHILNYSKVARHKCETLRTDDNIFDVWADFVVAGEEVTDYSAQMNEHTNNQELINITDMKRMLRSGTKLIQFITRARTPMTVSTKKYFKECDQY